VGSLGYRKDIPELLAIANVAVSSSKREGLPVNVLEAMGLQDCLWLYWIAEGVEI